MGRTPLSTGRIVLAVAVALIADAIQLPLAVGYATVILSVFSFFAVMAIDIVTMSITMALLGFHWALLPTFFAECVPGLDMFPTWTACVAYVIWCRKKEESHFPQHPVAGVREAEIIREIPALAASPTLPAPPEAESAETTPDQRLEHLADLRRRNLVTKEEYHAKRSQILGEL